MKTFKLIITGSKEEFNIQYNVSTDFGFNYKVGDFEGTEQDKFNAFCKEFKANGNSPLNVKSKMIGQNIDRAIPKNEVLKYTDVNEFVKKIVK